MTPHEKALAALNRRIEQLQAYLGEAKEEAAQRFVFQAIVVTVGLGEALNDYAKGVGAYAQRRHAEVKRNNETLAAQHADLLASGKGLLEQLKASPTDRAIRKQIEGAQRAMEAIQKNLRRGTNALQRDVAPGVAMIDKLADSVRRLCEADDAAVLKRVLRAHLTQVRDLYAAHPALPAKNLVDAAAWEKSAMGEIDQASDRHDAYARVIYQALLGLELAAIAVSESPPSSAEDAASRGNSAAAGRLRTITARLGAG